MKHIDTDNINKIANKVSINTIIVNIILSILKFVAGVIANSNAMISDAIHSASDVFSTVIVMIGIKFANKEPDKEHPYGHERLECITAIVLSMILFITGLGIGVDALDNIINRQTTDVQTPGILALVAAVISIITKELMYWYTRHYAKRVNSGSLMADAWHHRSDSLSSIGALIGIGFTMLGFHLMDSVASLVIFIFIVKAAYDIFKDAMDKLIDKSCDEDTEKQIYNHIIKNKDVIGIDVMRTRVFGNKVFVDVEILVDGNYTLNQAHSIAEEIHSSIEETFLNVKHIMVHVNSST